MTYKRNPEAFRYILVKRIKTPDGTIIGSNQAHNPVFHLDENGYTYMVDYDSVWPRVRSDGNHTDMSVYSDSPFEWIREHFTWGSYGKLGDEPIHCIKLKDLTTDHVKAIIDGNFAGMNQWLFEEELKWREEN